MVGWGSSSSSSSSSSLIGGACSALRRVLLLSGSCCCCSWVVDGSGAEVASGKGALGSEDGNEVEACIESLKVVLRTLESDLSTNVLVFIYASTSESSDVVNSANRSYSNNYLTSSILHSFLLYSPRNNYCFRFIDIHYNIELYARL